MTGVDELRLDAAVLSEAKRNPEVAGDMLWFRDTVVRVQVRYGRALAALAEVPALLVEVNRWQVPEAAWNEAEALNTAIRRAVNELQRVSDYLDAVLDPGPASCRSCGERLGAFSTDDRGWQHYQIVADPQVLCGQRFEQLDVDHGPVPVFGRPDYPIWQDPDLDRSGGELS